MLKSLWLYVSLAAAFALAFVTLQPPTPLSADAPAAQFSAGRAMADVRAIAQAPHPTGSIEIARVRTYLTERLGRLGLAPEIHPGQGIMVSPRKGAHFVAAGAVQNILAVLPGRDRTLPAVLVMSHYDTVRNSPGAADDTAGVAASLEIARLLKAGPPPARDVMFLFTDGEEAGLLGAEAFFRADPAAKHAGVVVNMEARGDSGLAAMFETGPGNAGLIDLMAAHVARPSAMSIASTLYHKMPNGTDLTVPIAKGLPGLNFAFADDQSAYHTPLARPDHLNAGALQHMGDSAAPVVAALAAAAQLPDRSEDAVYGDLFGRLLIHYPPIWGWAVLAAAVVLAGVSLARAHRAGKTGVMDLARGLALVPLTLSLFGLWCLLIAALFHLNDYSLLYSALSHGEALMGAVFLGALAIGVATAGGAVRGRGRWIASGAAVVLAATSGLLGWPIAPAAGLAVAAVLLALFVLSRPVSIWGVWGGALGLAALLGGALQALEPGVAPLITWPLLTASLAAFVAATAGRGEPQRGRGLALTALVAAPGIGLVLVWGGFVFTALGANLPPANLLTFLAAAPLLAPLFWTASRGPTGRVLAALSALVAVACLGLVATGPTAQRPGLTQAYFLADPAKSIWRRVSELPLDDWSAAALGQGGAKVSRVDDPPVVDAPAQSADVPAVRVVVPGLGAERLADRLIVKATPMRQGESLAIMLKPSARLTSGRLNGQPIQLDLPAGVWSTLKYEAPPPEGVTLAFDIPAHGAVEAAAAEVAGGWPPGTPPPPPKPANRMMLRSSDVTVTVARFTASW